MAEYKLENPFSPEICSQTRDRFGLLKAFDTGATRSKDDNKPDYEGFLSPLVIERYGQYMHSHRVQPDGSRRDSDNWQKGIPLVAYAKSLIRHVMQFWKLSRGYDTLDWDTGDPVDVEEMLCAILFNASGYLHETIKLRLQEENSHVS